MQKYAFEVLNADAVCSIIRDSNIPSQNVAIRNGMVVMDRWTKHYYGIDMPHCCYVVQRQDKNVNWHFIENAKFWGIKWILDWLLCMIYRT